MNSQKAGKLLTKIGALIDNIEDQDSISPLERDLLLSYVRRLYETVLDDDTALPEMSSSPSSQHGQLSPPVSSAEHVTPEQQIADKPVIVPPTPEATTVDQPIVDEPTIKPQFREQQIATPQVTEGHDVEYAQVSQPYPTPQSGLFNEATAVVPGNPALAKLFEIRASNEVGDKLRLQPIERIELAMGINERVLTVNELFDGDQKAFEETLSHLNGLSAFSQAKTFLIQGAAMKYLWDDAHRVKKAEKFIELVRRKYTTV